MSEKFQYLGGGSGEFEETYVFWIFDQRRCIAVRGIKEVLSKYEYAVDILNSCADDLLPDDAMIKVSDDMKWLMFSNKDKDDHGRFFPYLRFMDQADDVKLDIVRRSDIREEKIMYWLADIVSYVNNDDPNHLAVFKIVVHSSQLDRTWNKAHITRALKGHPSIVPFEKFVVDDAEERLIGWTSTFIKEGTLEENHSSTYFRLSWLTQMTEIIDDINLKYGIMHRDIAARNFLIDPETQQLLLFDFNNGMQIEDSSKTPQCHGPSDMDGVIFTIYELLTFNKSFREDKTY
jgi:serine/threonine protein kinase